MCDQNYFENDVLTYERLGKVTRKQFGMLLGAGMTMILPQVANALTVKDAEIGVKTPDGMADCYFVHPAASPAPGVLLWPDIFGLRPAFREMGKRLAQSGYAVLVVNPFYRTNKAPTAPEGTATPLANVIPLARSLNESTDITDAKAFVDWLDRQDSVAKDRMIGTQGYCMGGRQAFRTAASVPERVAAAASFHDSFLVTDKPDSPHLQAAHGKAQFLVLIAGSDDKRSPEDKHALRDTFVKAGRPATVEVYQDCAHGWCVPDERVYNEHEAERAWSQLLELYKSALAQA